MSHEFDDVVQDQAEQVGAELNRIERHGGSAGEVEEAFGPLDDVIGQLQTALSLAQDLKADLEGRADEVRHGLGLDEQEDEGYEDHGDGPLEGPLEELYENAYMAQDGEFENMTADEVF